jgi:hypothetical protein
MNQNGQTPSLALRLECMGLVVGGHTLPRFQVRAGEAVCLHVEYSPGSLPWYDCLLPLLVGRIQHPAIRLYGPAASLDRPFPRRRWLPWRRHPSTRDWLLYEGRLSPQEAEHVLSLVPVSPAMRVTSLGWNDRTMLALEACLLHPPELLVFDTAGSAVPTIQAVFDRLATRPTDLALAYLKTNLDAGSPCLPGASCYEIATDSPQTTAAVE